MHYVIDLRTDHTNPDQPFPPTSKFSIQTIHKRDTMTASTEQWMQFYDQQPQPIDDFPDTTINNDGPVHEALIRWDLGLERVDVRSLIPTSEEAISDTTMMTINPNPTKPLDTMSPTSSYTNNIGHLTPKGSVSKPIRRRSRASKRTPTTLLNANTKNFRALVQQFTGCPSSTLSSTSSSLAIHKGPITLNFQQGSKEIHHDTTTKVMSSHFSSRSHNHAHHVPVSFPQQQSGYSFDHVKNNHFAPTMGNSSSRLSTSNMDASDGLLVDNDFSLHDLTVNAFSSDAF